MASGRRSSSVLRRLGLAFEAVRLRFEQRHAAANMVGEAQGRRLGDGAPQAVGSKRRAARPGPGWRVSAEVAPCIAKRVRRMGSDLG